MRGTRAYATSLLFVILGVFFSCSNGKKEFAEYPFEKEYLQYLIDVHSSEPKKNHIYYLLDLYSCDPCINANLGLLSKLGSNENITLVYINKPRFNTWDSQIESINDKFMILRDSVEEANLYELGLFKPLLLYFGEDGIEGYMNISDFQIGEAQLFLEERVY